MFILPHSYEGIIYICTCFGSAGCSLLARTGRQRWGYCILGDALPSSESFPKKGHGRANAVRAASRGACGMSWRAGASWGGCLLALQCPAGPRQFSSDKNGRGVNQPSGVMEHRCSGTVQRQRRGGHVGAGERQAASREPWASHVLKSMSPCPHFCPGTHQPHTLAYPPLHLLFCPLN